LLRTGSAAQAWRVESKPDEVWKDLAGYRGGKMVVKNEPATHRYFYAMMLAGLIVIIVLARYAV